MKLKTPTLTQQRFSAVTTAANHRGTMKVGGLPIAPAPPIRPVPQALKPMGGGFGALPPKVKSDSRKRGARPKFM